MAPKINVLKLYCTHTHMDFVIPNPAAAGNGENQLSSQLAQKKPVLHQFESLPCQRKAQSIPGTALPVAGAGPKFQLGHQSILWEKGLTLHHWPSKRPWEFPADPW